MSALREGILPEGRVADYDLIADRYDAFFADEESHNENLEIFNRLAFDGNGRVLDIGCGTGLFLDYAGCQQYVGIDPSAKMLEKFVQAHQDRPGLKRVRTTFEKFEDTQGFDLIVAMFGAASYVSPDHFERVFTMVRPGGRVFAMFYQERYIPLTYEKAGVAVPHFQPSHYDLTSFELSKHRNSFLIAEYTAHV